MKIIREGFQIRRYGTPDIPWWVGRHHTCPGCGCEVQLEEGDAIHPHESVVSYLCPQTECGYYVPIPYPPEVLP